MCTQCELGSLEDANHLIMQCPTHEIHRVNMHEEINAQYDLEVGEFTLEVMLGNYLTNKDYDQMCPLWYISSKYIYMMYSETLLSRRGIG